MSSKKDINLPVAWMHVTTKENGILFHFDIANAQVAFDLADGEHLLYLHPTEDKRDAMTFDEWDKSVRDEYGNMKFDNCYEAVKAAWNAAMREGE